MLGWRQDLRVAVSQALKGDFGIPESLNPTIVIGFGYPQRKLYGRKNRKSLSEVAFLEKYGDKLGPGFEAAQVKA